MYQAHEQQVLQTKYLSVVETPLKVLDKAKKGTTHQGYYWVYYNTQSRQVLFKYHFGRSAEWPKETLANYAGYLQTDGYAPTINLIMCLVLLPLIAGPMPGVNF